MDKGNIPCMTYCGFLGLWCGDKHTTVSCCIQQLSCKRQRLNLFIAAEGRKNFWGGKTKFWMAFQRDFVGQTLNKSTAAVGRKKFLAHSFWNNF